MKRLTSILPRKYPLKENKNVIISNKSDKECQCDISSINIQMLFQALEKLPKFDGTENTDFSSFVNVFECKLKLLRVPEKDIIELLLNCITGKALELLSQEHYTFEINNWHQTIKTLTQIFSQLNTKATVTINTLRQRKRMQTETLENYASSIKEIVNQIFHEDQGYDSKLKENEMIRYFVRGIDKRTKEELKGKSYSSLNMVLEAAKKLEVSYEGP